MSTEPKKLLDDCLEIEGLLALLIVRNGHCTSETYNLLRNKVSQLKDSIFELEKDIHSTINTDTQPSTPSITNSNENCEDNVVCIDEPIEASQPALEVVGAVLEDLHENTHSEREQLIDDNDKTGETINEETPVPEMHRHNTGHSEILTTNESLSAMFSINDKFFYSRELFNSSLDEMEEALEVTSVMTSAADIEDYLSNDLCFDMSSDIVQDFYKALTSRFVSPNK